MIKRRSKLILALCLLSSIAISKPAAAQNDGPPRSSLLSGGQDRPPSLLDRQPALLSQPTRQAAPVPRRNAPQNNVIIDKSATRPYSIRVTNGSYQYSGWEKNLVEGDNNLRHWTWMPMAGFNQGYKNYGPPGNNLPPRSKNPIYIKPIHVPLTKYEDERKQRAAEFAKARDARRTATDVNAQIKVPAKPPEVQAEGEEKVYSYGDTYAKLKTEPSASAVSGNLGSKDVYGKLLKKPARKFTSGSP